MPAADSREMEQLTQRVERLESQMEFLFRRMGISQARETAGTAPHEQLPKWKPSPAVMSLIEKGDRKGALKQFMQESGASLKDAVEYIDRL